MGVGACVWKRPTSPLRSKLCFNTSVKVFIRSAEMIIFYTIFPKELFGTLGQACNDSRESVVLIGSAEKNNRKYSG